MIIKRLTIHRENVSSLADDFGVHLDHPEHAHPDRERRQPGLDQLRMAITEINVQIAMLEQQYERLYAARAQLFGVGDGQWHETNVPIDTPPQFQGREVRKGDYGTHP